VPYTLQEESLILAACDKIGGGKYNRSGAGYEQLRARAMIMVLRHTALRISDVCTLRKDAVSWDPEAGTWRVFLYTQKTGDSVFPPLAIARRRPPSPRVVLWPDVDDGARNAGSERDVRAAPRSRRRAPMRPQERRRNGRDRARRPRATGLPAGVSQYVFNRSWNGPVGSDGVVLPNSQDRHGKDYAASRSVQPSTGVAATLSIRHSPGFGIAP
jgi:integrase